MFILYFYAKWQGWMHIHLLKTMVHRVLCTFIFIFGFVVRQHGRLERIRGYIGVSLLWRIHFCCMQIVGENLITSTHRIILSESHLVTVTLIVWRMVEECWTVRVKFAKFEEGFPLKTKTVSVSETLSSTVKFARSYNGEEGYHRSKLFLSELSVQSISDNFNRNMASGQFHTK